MLLINFLDEAKWEQRYNAQKLFMEKTPSWIKL